MGGSAVVEEHDGRRLRRSRNRLAVIEAYVDLMRTGVHEPTRDELAAACGVSRRSIYRYFPDEPALIAAVADHLVERFGPILASPSIGSGTLPERAHAFVIGRLDAYDLTAPITRAVRLSRANDETVTRAFDAARLSARDHLLRQFAEELDGVDDATREQLVTALHAPFLFDGLEYAHAMHDRRDTVVELLARHVVATLTALR